MARFRGAERQAEKLEKLKKMRKKTPLDAALVDKKTPLDAALQNLADKKTSRGTNQSQIKRKADDSSCKPVDTGRGMAPARTGVAQISGQPAAWQLDAGLHGHK